MALNEKEKLKLAKERLAVEEKIAALQGRDISQNFSEVENIKEILSLNTKKTEFDREILKSARDLNDQVLKNISGITTINKLAIARVRTEAKANKAQKLANEVSNSLSSKQIKLLEKLKSLRASEEGALADAAEIQEKIDKGVLTQQQGQAQLNKFKKIAGDLDVKQEKIIQKQLTSSAKLVLSSEQLAKAGFSQVKLQKEVLKTTDGAAVKTAEFLKLIPGFGNVANRVIENIEEGIEDVLSGETSIEEFNKEFSATNVLGKSVLNKFNLLSAAATALFLSFTAINKAQVQIRRNLGESADFAQAFSSEFATATELLEISNSLIEQFGFNVNDAFSDATLKSATELSVAVGLTAEEAGQFAFLSTISGDNLERQLESAVKQVNPLISARQILQQVGNISSFIAINFDNNVVALTRAANKAKELGLELSQIDKVADSLLDIESSITSEFEARMITGQELNLNAARFFALNNDLEGVTREIANNEQIISTFAGTNRVAQEAIADAIGLSRDEIASMLNEQQMLNSMSAKERKAKEYSEMKSIENQERFRKAVQLLAESVSVFLEPLATIVSSISTAVSFIVDGLNAVTGVLPGFLKGFANLAIIAAMLGVFTGKGLLVPLGIAGGLAVAGIISRFTKADDMFSPGYGKRTILSPEGAIALNDNDTVIAGTRLGRNAGLSRGDIKAIASAVRDGASQANINLNGGRVSARLQVPNVINQRQYSI
jgi:hypothetical protein